MGNRLQFRGNPPRSLIRREPLRSSSGYCFQDRSIRQLGWIVDVGEIGRGTIVAMLGVAVTAA